VTGAKVKVGNEPVPGTDNQPISFSGTELQVQAALAMVNEIAANPSALTAQNNNTSAVTSGGAGGAGGKTETKFIVPATLVGRIIGHGGSTIQQIRSTSGAKIHLANEVNPGTQDHAITVTGSDSQIQAAIALINEELAQAAGGTAGLLNPASMAPPAAYMPHMPQMPQAPPGYMLVPVSQMAQMGAADPTQLFLPPTDPANFMAPPMLGTPGAVSDQATMPPGCWGMYDPSAGLR